MGGLCFVVTNVAISLKKPRVVRLKYSTVGNNPKKMTRLIFITLLHLFSIASIFSQGTHDKLSGLDEEITILLNKYQAVGLSVAIVSQDSIIYSKGFGYRDLKEKLEMNKNTCIPIGSTTKTFTSALIGNLYSKGEISLTAKPSQYIPNLEFYNDRMNNLISVEDLLSHRSGLGGIDASHVLFPPDNGTDYIKRLKHLKPNGEVKSSFHYSNAGYALLGQIIEETTGLSYDNFLKETIFTPLEMTHTFTEIEEMQKTENYALPYGKLNNQQKRVPFHEFRFSKPDGAVISSSDDLGKWMIAWMNDGKYKDKQIIPKDYVNLSTTLKNIMPQGNANEEDYLFGYGYGWFVQSSKGEYFIQHGGNTSGFSCQLAIYPHKKIGIVVITNQHNSALPYFIEDIISNRMLGLPKKPIDDYPVYVTDIYPVPQTFNSFNPLKKISHKPESYCGYYENKGHGIVEVIEESGNLFILFPEHKFRLEHEQYNTFRMQPIKEMTQYVVPDFQLNFNINEEGNIDGFNVNFQPEHVVFKKN
jgi:CubicO group peptidase (beta-lactamase class C family)